MKRTEIFVGSCSKYIDGQGWTTEIPISQLTDKGYVNIKELKKAIWNYVGKTGTIIENNNIDYVIEQAVKDIL